MSDVIKALGERMQTRMIEIGKTQAQVGKETQIGRSHINEYVKGKYAMSAEKLAKIAQSLECSTDYLLGLSDSPQKQ